jgi:SUMO ligase MMS21 Smc5/6 complex component
MKYMLFLDIIEKVTIGTRRDLNDIQSLFSRRQNTGTS